MWQVRVVAWTAAVGAGVYGLAGGQPPALFLAGLAVVAGEALALVPRRYQRLCDVAAHHGMDVRFGVDPVGATVAMSPVLDRGRIRKVAYAATGTVDGRPAALLRYVSHNHTGSMRGAGGHQRHVLWIAGMHLAHTAPAMTIRSRRWRTQRGVAAPAAQRWRVDDGAATAEAWAGDSRVAAVVDRIVTSPRRAVVVEGGWLMVTCEERTGIVPDLEAETLEPARDLTRALAVR